ncbi:MAG TPA: trypsin-like peptidase domain-containing protein [Dongiaceae bacterium]|nr:trypsin-like peptidase domain-containing protein [Dongiaceae bacterium]
MAADTRFNTFTMHCRRLLVLMLCVGLVACATPRVVVNEKASVKPTDYNRYHTVYFIQPKEDPRNVAPRIVEQLRAMQYEVLTVDQEQGMAGSQGTGFMITRQGHLLTCAHVLGKQNTATITVKGKRYQADLVAKDEKLDVALLRLRDGKGAEFLPISFRRGDRYAMGEDVFTIGYPMSALLGESSRMSKGLLSATAGIKDDPNQVQISAEIAPGNSGGPVLDKNGQIIGVVQQTLNPWRVAQETGGALPQNINFATKSTRILDFIRTTDQAVFNQLTFDRTTAFEQVDTSVVKIRSGIITEEWEKMPKLVMLLDYVSVWDLWYRFRLFVVRAYDYDSHEILFMAGQGGDSLTSSEDTVINDTVQQVRTALGK